MKIAASAISLFLLGTGVAMSACDGPDGSSVPIGDSKCFNGALMRCEQLSAGSQGLIFKERCPVVTPPKQGQTLQTRPRPQVETQPSSKRAPYPEPPSPYVAPTAETKCNRLKDQFNAKTADYRRRCTPGVAIPIALANACNAEAARLRGEQANIKRQCPQLPILPAH